MNETTNIVCPVFWKKHKWVIAGVVGSLVAALVWPYHFVDTVSFVLKGMLEVSPLVIPGILISAWVNADATISAVCVVRTQGLCSTSSGLGNSLA